MKITEKGQYSKEKIINAAQYSFRKYGIDNVTIDDICNNAGLTRGAFYHHFNSKQSLLAELYSNWISRFADIPKKFNISKDKPVDIERFLFEAFEYSRTIFNEAGEELPLFLELNILAIRDDDLKEYIMHDQKDYLNFLTEIISTNKKVIDKKIKPKDVARIIFSLILGLSIICLQNPQDADWVDLAKDSVRLIFG